jgi:hypothetical protein
VEQPIQNPSTGSTTFAAAITAFHPHRNLRLFNEFLPKGYSMISMIVGESQSAHDALQAKIMLGSLITFEDDLADHPNFFDFHALKAIYDGDNSNVASLSESVRLARKMRTALWSSLHLLPNFDHFEELMRFDLQQFTSANQYSALTRVYRGMENITESKHFSSFNMGVVLAATIDLMAMPLITGTDLAAVREAAYLAQRAGRISNIITTLDREKREGDFTNEVIVAQADVADEHTYLRQIECERQAMIAKIRTIAHRTDKVDLDDYADGIERLHKLHLFMSEHI